MGVGEAAGSGVSSCLGSFRPLIPEAGLWPTALSEFARGPKYATEQIGDELVLVLAARLVSESGLEGNTDSSLPQRCEVQTCAAKPSSAGHFLQRKPGLPSTPQTCLGAFLSEPRVHRAPPRCHSPNLSPLHTLPATPAVYCWDRSGLIWLYPRGKRAQILPRAPVTAPARELRLCLFVCF